MVNTWEKFCAVEWHLLSEMIDHIVEMVAIQMEV